MGIFRTVHLPPRRTSPGLKPSGYSLRHPPPTCVVRHMAHPSTSPSDVPGLTGRYICTVVPWPGRLSDDEASTMLFDNPMRNRQPQARAFGLCRKEWREQLPLDLRRNPHALVGELHDEHRPATWSKTDRFTRAPRRQCRTAPVRHGLPGIADEIQKSLRQMITVGPEIREARIVVLLNLHATHDASRSFQGDDAVENFVHIDLRPCEGMGSGKIEHLFHQHV